MNKRLREQRISKVFMRRNELELQNNQILQETHRLMQGIRKQIHSALLNVSRLCDQFFRKYPQYYPSPILQTPYETFPLLHFGGYPPISSQYSVHPDPWTNSTQLPLPHSNKIMNISKEKDSKPQSDKTSKTNKNSIQLSKKCQKQLKKEQKKSEELKQQEKQKIKPAVIKGKVKIKNTLKNRIKRDSRLADRPKFPMSPYFLYLKQMRSNISQTSSNNPTSKQFAQQMGKNWREMSEQKKSPYVIEYLKSRKIYDQKIAQFYAKYPDLKPKNSPKNSGLMYPVDDTKYQTEQVVIEEQQLENDLIDELDSQEDGFKHTQFNADGQIEDRKKLEDSLTLSDERIQLESPTTGRSPLHAVEID